MCLITTQKEPKIAEHDLISYKLLQEDLRPILFYITKDNKGFFKYVLGELNKTEIKVGGIYDWQCFGDVDLDWVERFTQGQSWSQHPDLINFTEGFHSSFTKEPFNGVTIDRVGTSPKWLMFECTIPKGSEYYENPVGLVVSNQIIINKQINLTS